MWWSMLCGGRGSYEIEGQNIFEKEVPMEKVGLQLKYLGEFDMIKIKKEAREIKMWWKMGMSNFE